MTDLVTIFANNLLPILLLVGAGVAVGEALNLNARALALVTFNIFSPCLVFDLMVNSGLGGDDVVNMATLAVATTLATGGLGWVTGLALGLPRARRAALVLVAMLPNAGNYGLSLNKLAFGEGALAHASVFFITTSVLLYTVGVLVASLGTVDLKAALLGLLRVPAVYAVVLGLLTLRLSWELPLPLARTVSLGADAAIPAFLVVLGLQLHRARAVQLSRELSLAVGLRLLGSPAVALALLPLLALEGPARQAGMVEAAMPTAVATTVLAEAYDVEPAFVTAAVLVSTVLSPLTLTPLLSWLQA